MALAGSEFLDSVRYHARSWSLSQSIVMECPAARFDVDPGGEIMVLDTFCLAVVIAPDRFESRRPLPAHWRGLRVNELSKRVWNPWFCFCPYERIHRWKSNL
ncbi:uncharacterized protein LOC110665917 isoform X2 [Hevea brasiliensis]|uniref:uncharacterized protein LOC110665917 isoform X2 n=1 Tax=Hevea brasiliensis TaxID=3981 RepID=UPI0025E12E9C|nr:uncharacterized protein LOC110665917 isoform X2 [Hevea brasiliensis]